jgi:hypothetical protein
MAWLNRLQQAGNMIVRVLGRWMLALGLGVLILGGLVAVIGGASADAAPESIERDWEPVIVIGAELGHLQGTPTDELFVYAHRESHWQQVPFQVDEKASGVYTSTQGNPLDGDDEIAFMAADLGDRPADEDIATSLPIDPTWYRIEVTDPLSPTAGGWAYVVRSASLSASSPETYASFDPVTERIVTSRYALGFLAGHPGLDYLALNGSGEDILDRTKLRLYVFGSLAGTEENLEAPAPVPVKDGPVRVIMPRRSVIGYQALFHIRIDEELPSPYTTAARLSTDFSPDIVPATYYDANTPAGVAIDGEPDGVPETPLSGWCQVSSDTGSLVQVSDASGSGGTPKSYYKDNKTVDANDTGDGVSYGDAGTRVEDPEDAVVYYSWIYVLPGSQPNVGAAYADYVAHPLQVTATPGLSCPAPLVGVSISGPSLGDTDETLVFTANPEPSDATEPITYTWSEDGLVSGQGTPEAAYRWESAGEKQVEVAARNCGGQDVSDARSVTISEGCAVAIAGVTISGPDSGYTDAELGFSATVDPPDATEPITYMWSSDGLIEGAGTASAIYRWATAGTHLIGVGVENCGGLASDSHAVVVSEPPSCDRPLTGVSLSGPSSGDTDETLVFTASPEPGNATGPITYTWSEDGLVSGQGESEVAYRWAGAGEKEVEVTARNCGGQDVSDSRSVTISEGCAVAIAGVTISGPDSGDTGAALGFSATVDPPDATEPITYTWSSDGLIEGAGTANVTYQWATTGTHVISVTVQNCGGLASDSHAVVVSEPPSCDHPLTGVSLSGPGVGETDETLVFTASPEPGNATEPITYAWSEDGLVSGQGESEAAYRWAGAGEKQVEVTARNCGGQDVSDSRSVTISEGCAVAIAGVTISGPDSGYADAELGFSATVDPPDATEPITYTWSSDGLIEGAGTASAIYRWATTGTHLIGVGVQNCGGLASDSHAVVVSEPPSCDHPLTGVSLSGPSLGDTDETLVFTASPEPSEATEPITYAWSEDGLVSGQGESEAAYRWASAGEKQVEVTARNCGGQVFKDSQPVEVREHVYLPVVMRH